MTWYGEAPKEVQEGLKDYYNIRMTQKEIRRLRKLFLKRRLRLSG